MNNLALATSMVTAPSAAFAELRERPRFWFPLLLITLSTAAMCYWYYSVVDFEWLKDMIFSSNPKMQAMPEAQRTAAMGMMGRGTMMWGSVIGSLIVIPLFSALWALYLLLAAKITKLPLGFKHWFALTCWTSLPILLGVVVSAIFLAMAGSNPQVSPGVMQPLSLNELLLHRPMGSPGEALLDSLSIPGLLSWALLVIGVHTWSQRSWGFSAAFIVLPIVVIFGIWAFIAFR